MPWNFLSLNCLLGRIRFVGKRKMREGKWVDACKFDRAKSRPSTLKAPITNAADDIHDYFFIVFQRK